MKIPKDDQTRHYELTYLVSTQFSEPEYQSINEVVDGFISKHDGTTISVDEWGKKTLAYPVQKAGGRHTEAYYRHLLIEMLPANINALVNDIKLEDQVLRNLVIVSENTESEEATTKELAAETE